jgi:hypothetical protein
LLIIIEDGAARELAPARCELEQRVVPAADAPRCSDALFDCPRPDRLDHVSHLTWADAQAGLSNRRRIR